MKRTLLVVALILGPCSVALATQEVTAGSTDEYVYFIAVDSVDFHTRETGLSSFTVRYSINGGADAAADITDPAQISAANQPGVYKLKVDDANMTTLPAGKQQANMIVHITKAGMDPVTLTVLVKAEAADSADMQAAVTAAAAAAPLQANVTQMAGHSMAGTGTQVADAFETMFNVASPVFTVASVNQTVDVRTALPQNMTFTSVGGTQMPQVTTNGWNGTAVSSPDTAGYPVVTIKDGTGTGEIDTNAGAVATNVTQMGGQTVTAAAGITVNANVGTTQPINFDGTGASALVKSLASVTGDLLTWLRKIFNNFD